jgi:UDP-N-acetylmuramoylalanine--D-glutamate ligase
VRAVDARLDITPWRGVDLRTMPIVLRLGEVHADAFAGCDGVALSPGVSPQHPAIQAAHRAGIPVFGELELQVPLPARCLAVSGTNGKSTTTALAGALVQALGRTAFVGGNLGPPIAAWLAAPHATDAAVLELSSYQLDGAYRFAPEVAVLLNVTPDHLERYGTMAAYAASKARLVTAVPAEGRLVLNYDDAHVRQMAPGAQAPIWWFSTEQARLPPGYTGAVCVDDTLVGQGSLAALQPMALAHPRLLGRHNRQNALAAMLGVLALCPRAEQAALQEAYAQFAGLEHRLELVAELDQVCYVNDSKATNDAAAATAVQAMDRPVILLAGGQDKGGGYARLRQACAGRSMRHVIAFGAARGRIAAELAQLPVGLTQVETLEDALQLAHRTAVPGDVVLLAPACASFDAFANYQQRGHAFKNWLRGRVEGS